MRARRNPFMPLMKPNTNNTVNKTISLPTKCGKKNKRAKNKLFIDQKIKASKLQPPACWEAAHPSTTIVCSILPQEHPGAISIILLAST